MSWPTGEQPYGPNRAPLLAGVSSSDGRTVVPVGVDPTNGALEVGIGSVAVDFVTVTATVYTGQKTVNTTAVQLSASSHTLINGVIVKSPSTNSGIIYVGMTGVTTSTGDILEPGEARGYAVNNTNLLYIISAASTTDVVSWSGN